MQSALNRGISPTPPVAPPSPEDAANDATVYLNRDQIAASLGGGVAAGPPDAGNSTLRLRWEGDAPAGGVALGPPEAGNATVRISRDQVRAATAAVVPPAPAAHSDPPASPAPAEVAFAPAAEVAAPPLPPPPAPLVVAAEEDMDGPADRPLTADDSAGPTTAAPTYYTPPPVPESPRHSADAVLPPNPYAAAPDSDFAVIAPAAGTGATAVSYGDTGPVGGGYSPPAGYPAPDYGPPPGYGPPPDYGAPGGYAPPPGGYAPTPPPGGYTPPGGYAPQWQPPPPNPYAVAPGAGGPPYGAPGYVAPPPAIAPPSNPALMWVGVALLALGLLSCVCFLGLGLLGSFSAGTPTGEELGRAIGSTGVCGGALLLLFGIPGGVLFYLGRRR